MCRRSTSRTRRRPSCSASTDGDRPRSSSAHRRACPRCVARNSLSCHAHSAHARFGSTRASNQRALRINARFRLQRTRADDLRAMCVLSGSRARPLLLSCVLSSSSRVRSLLLMCAFSSFFRARSLLFVASAHRSLRRAGSSPWSRTGSTTRGTRVDAAERR